MVFPEEDELTKEDYVIIAGDFGFIFDHTKSGTKELKWLDWLENRKYTVLFVDGNHECHPRLNALETKDMFSGTVGVVRDGIYHLRRGEVYIIGGKKFFAFGGADSIDKDWRIQGISWWPEEIPSVIEFNYGWKNLERNNWEVDYVITHTAPDSVLPDFFRTVKPRDPTTIMLDRYYEKLSFKLWVCGHWHCDSEFSPNVQCLYNTVKELK